MRYDARVSRADDRDRYDDRESEYERYESRQDESEDRYRYDDNEPAFEEHSSRYEDESYRAARDDFDRYDSRALEADKYDTRESSSYDDYE